MCGAAERLVGDLLSITGHGENAFIATKVCTEGKQNGIDQVHQSMALLRVDAIDLIQVHNLVDWRTHLPTLRDWKEQGLIRYIGVTHHTSRTFDQLESVVASEKIDFVKLPYSLTLRDAEDRLLPLAADKGVAVIANRPFDGGGMFSLVRRPPLPDWAKEIDCGSWATFFAKYLLGDPAVTCLIPATGSASHVAENLSSGIEILPDVEMSR